MNLSKSHLISSQKLDSESGILPIMRLAQFIASIRRSLSSVIRQFPFDGCSLLGSLDGRVKGHLTVCGVLAFVIFVLSAAVAVAQSVGPGIQPDGTSMPKQSGMFYGPTVNGTPAAAALSAANTLYAAPFFMGSTATAKTLTFNITTGNTAAWNARLCIYADNGGRPGALVVDGGTVAIASGSVTGNQTATLPGGGTSLYGPAWYWLAFNADSASESLSSLNNYTNSAILSSSILGGPSSNSLFAPVTNAGVKVSQAFGACPSTFGAAANNAPGSMPYIVVGF